MSIRDSFDSSEVSFDFQGTMMFSIRRVVQFLLDRHMLL